MEKVLIFGHKSPDTDTICSSIVMEKLQNQKMGEGFEAVRLGEINKETEYALNYFKVEKPRLIESVEEGQKVILVDHNEAAQSADGIEKAEITSVVDHHKIKIQTSTPLFYMCQPVGCTSTIIYEIAKMNNLEIDKTMAGLMLSAIISDTLLLKSPTCTEKDVKAAKELEKIAEVDMNVYGLEMLKAGTDLSIYTEKELLKLDSKQLEKDGVKYMVAQVNTVSIESVLERKEKIEQAMQEAIAENGINLLMFVITDIVNSNSEAIVLGDKTDVVTKSYEIKDNIIVMPGVVSRKKQIIPLIESNI